MATIVSNALMKHKSSSGNVYLVYPITLKENVAGIDEAIRNQSVVTKGTGAVYTATVEGITSLSAGVSFVMIPHTVSTTSSPKLNVNGLGEKLIQRRVSNCTGTFYNASAPNDWLTAGKPVTMTYDGQYWVADLPVPNANDIMGAVPIANGGTGATTATQARINLGIETTDGTVSSGNENYAEVGEWVDGNPDAEDRIGYFVCVDNTTSKMTMRKATEIDDVRGVTITAPAFSGNCSNDKFDSDGNLIAKYSFVAVMGIASVIDNGTCTVNGRCMPKNDGTAMPSPNSMGYQVISRIDATHVLILVEPQADMLVRIKNDVTQKADLPKTVSGTVISLDDASDGPLQGLRIYGRTTQDGTPTPDNPVPLVSVSNPNIVFYSNLFDKNNVVDSWIVNSDGSENSNAAWSTSNFIGILPNSYLYFSISERVRNQLAIHEYDANKSFIISNRADNRETANPFLAVKTTPDTRYVRVGYRNDLGTKELLLNYGTERITYSEYKESQVFAIPCTLNAIPVTSGGNYTDANGQQWICDEVDFARGVYVQRVKKRKITSTDNWASSSGGRYHLTDNEFYNINVAAFCTHFNRAASWIYHLQTDGTFILYRDPSWSNGRLSFKYSAFDSLDSWKQFLDENDVNVLYEIANPIETDLTAEELAQYAAIHTNKPNTTVYNDAGAHMDVGYYPPDATMRQEDIMGALDNVSTSAKAYADAKRFTVPATITADWIGDAAPYTQVVTVSGVLETDMPHITPVYTNADTLLAEKEAWGMITYAIAGNGSITFACYEDKPAVAINIIIEVIR